MTHFDRRRSIFVCFVKSSWAKNLSIREHPCGNFLHSRRSPRTERAQGSLEHSLVASMPAARGMPDMLSGQIVAGGGMVAMRLAVWRQATGA